MQQVLLVDGLNLVRRIFEARGRQGGELFVQACEQSLRRCLEDVKPSHGLVIWDSPLPTWRHQLDANYKANRPPTPADLLADVPQLQQEFARQGVKSFTVDGFEADDVIASIAVKLREANIEVVVVSTDKTFLPLMASEVKIYHQFDRAYVLRAEVETRFGLALEQLVDYWALSGDNSNNIKGVPGIGKKSATELLQQHGTIEGVITSETSKKVNEHAETARLCQQLVQLKTDVALGVNLKDFRIGSH